jgi:L-ascorbate metabolism protein UlaG (beta-lactamase superfamily)
MKLLLRSLKVFAIILVVLAAIIFVFMQQRPFGKTPSGEHLAKISQSPQYKNNRFENLKETPMLAEGTSYMKILGEFFFSKGIDREPADSLPHIKTDLKSLPGQPVMIWFGHSSYLISIGGKKILVDPVFSERPSPVQYAGSKSYNGTMIYTADDFPDIDLVIISHDHYDHLDYNTIVQLKDRVKVFCTPLGVGSHLVHWGVPQEHVHELDWWESINPIPGIDLVATPARHFSGRGLVNNKTLWASFVLKTEGKNIFIGGDSGYDDSFKKIGERYGPFDIAMLECGQYDKQWPYIHMMPEESVQASIDLQAKVYMPVHWAKFKLALHPWREPVERALTHAAKLNVTAATPRIGEVIHLDNIPAAAPWWPDPIFVSR